MSKDPNFAQGIEMPAMKKNVGGAIDLMRPGNGTPWEDRGATGAVAAYFKTAIKSMTSPGLLMDHIRRPETTSDANVFAGISIAMWVVGVLIYNAYDYFKVLPSPDSAYELIDPMYFWISAVGQAIVVAVGLAVFLRVGPRLYRSLGATELKQATPSLIQNCFSYAMGPSILAIIPFYGWIVAGIWIVIDLMVAGKRRLYMKGSGAVINVLILAFLSIAVAVVAYFAFHLIWGKLLDMSGVALKVAPPPPKGFTPSP